MPTFRELRVKIQTLRMLSGAIARMDNPKMQDIARGWLLEKDRELTEFMFPSKAIASENSMQDLRAALNECIDIVINSGLDESEKIYIRAALCPNGIEQINQFSKTKKRKEKPQ